MDDETHSKELESEGGDREDVQPQESPLHQRVAEKVRADSVEVQLTPSEAFSLEPFDLTYEAFLDVVDDLAEHEDCRDVASIVEEGRIEYLYSTTFISDSYAGMLVRKLRNDPVRMIAETVRDESRVYPRPMPIVVFGYPPFSLTEEEALQSVRALLERPEYADIHEIVASTGATYLFSDGYTLSEPKAREMVEWEEVGRLDNP